LFSPHEWLSWKLGARPVTVIPHKGYVPYYWDEEQCLRFGIDKDRFPPFVKMGELIGELNSTLFSALPPTAPRNKVGLVQKLLEPGTPIIAGASDFIMALIGTGTLEPGTACDRTGSSEGINLCLAEEDTFIRSVDVGKPLYSELRLLPHAIEGLWNLGALIPQSGSLFDAYRVSSGQSKRPYGELTAEILADPAHLGRPVLETMGLNLVKALEKIEASGHRITEMVLSGGQSADFAWNQYKADLSGKILKVPEIIHAELAGNAILAAATVEGGSIREKAATMIRIKERYMKAVPNSFS
jgi:sugar (pentulose or hexulose) kinase